MARRFSRVQLSQERSTRPRSIDTAQVNGGSTPGAAAPHTSQITSAVIATAYARRAPAEKESGPDDV